MKEEGDESGRAAGLKNGDMKQRGCWEITKRTQWRPRPAWTGSKNHKGEAEIKGGLGTGRTALGFGVCLVFFLLFQLSHSLHLQGQAATGPPCAHFTAQASINYQRRTLDIDRHLGCRAASANTVASEETAGAVAGAGAEPCSSVRLTGRKNQRRLRDSVLGNKHRIHRKLTGKINAASQGVFVLLMMIKSLVTQSTAHSLKVLMETELRGIH